MTDLFTESGRCLQAQPWQAYPRPQMKRTSFVNLNGHWEFTAADTSQLPSEYDQRILVPFCPESLLSGVHRHFPEGTSLFYRRKFTIEQPGEGKRFLLHFGAVDQLAQIYVNRKSVCTHLGGYEAFCVDITDYLQEENELIVRATDDLRDGVQPYGKQTRKRGGMWYTPVSGIWQSVWGEWVSPEYIQALDIQTDGKQAVITLTPALDGVLTLEGKTYPVCRGQAVVSPESPRLWSPEDPYLYRFTVETAQDRVESYFALRTLEVRSIDGIARLCLNGKPYFFHGLLDQGYWSDGLFTPASPEDYSRDILQMKNLGFNTLRKHIKVEPEQFYYDCDRYGMIVFQDMVNNGKYSFFRDTALPTVGLKKRKDKKMHKNPAVRKAFLQGMEATVRQLKNHPCICYWTVFNEGWGQFDSDGVYERLQQLDGSRWIDSTSGWFHQKKTDVESLHVYFKKLKIKPVNKPVVLSEFGGYCYAVTGHLFNPHKAYGYKACKTLSDFNRDLQTLYREQVLPAVKQGLCGAIYTQVSDVEDEINGLLTYDRKVCKVDALPMQQLAAQLQNAMKGE